MGRCYKCHNDITKFEDMKTVYFGSDPIACCLACYNGLLKELGIE